jgi:hypothetical protein
MEVGREELNQRLWRARPDEAEPPPPPPKPPQQQWQQPPDVEAVLTRLPNLIDEERDWIRQHADSVITPQNQKLMKAAFIESERRGLKRGSPEYFAHFADRLGYNEGGYTAAQPSRHVQRDVSEYPTEDNRRVAAPVSRGGGGTAERLGQVFLNEAMREAARVSGISEAEYARQMVRLREPKKRGYYQ